MYIEPNLLKNSSFENGLTGWGNINGANSTATISTDDSYFGDQSALVTYTTSTVSATFTSATATTTAITYNGTSLNTIFTTSDALTVTGFTGANASRFNITDGDITSVSSTQVVVTLNGVSGTATGTGTGTAPRITNPGILSASGDYRVNVQEGEVWTFSCYVKAPSTNAGSSVDLLARIYTYTSGGSSVSNFSGTVTNITNSNGWTRLSVTGTMAATAALARVGVYHSTSTSTALNGDGFYVDGMKFEKSSSATQYVPFIDQAVETSTVNKALSDLLPGDIDTKPYITGLKLQQDVSFNGLVLNTIDGEKNIWVCTDIKGWWNLPEPEVPDIPRGLDDGSYDVRGRWKARNITLEGSILPSKPENSAAARKTLVEATNLVYTGGWLRVDEDPEKASYVRVVGLPTIENKNARGRIDFSIPLRAGDPIKYGWDSSGVDGITTSNVAVTSLGDTSTVTAITNDGNTNVSCVFTITGPLTAPAYIKNTTANTTIKIVKDLRPAGFYQTTVTTRSRSSGVNTLTTAAEHGFLEGDIVTVGGMGVTAQNGDFTLTAVTANTISYLDPGVNVTSATITSSVVTMTTASAHGASVGDSVYVTGLGVPFDGTYTTIAGTSGTTIVYNRTYTGTKTAYEGNVSRELSSSADAGTTVLKNVDTLQLDTYNTTVLYRGIADSARSTLDVDIDWIKLKPGSNNIQLQKSGNSPTMTIKYRSGWIG